MRVEAMSRIDSLPRYEMYIDGAQALPALGEYFPTQDPYTGRDWAMVARGSADDVERAVDAAKRAFETGPWPALSASGRGALLRRLADLIVVHAPRLAQI